MAPGWSALVEEGDEWIFVAIESFPFESIFGRGKVAIEEAVTELSRGPLSQKLVVVMDCHFSNLG